MTKTLRYWRRIDNNHIYAEYGNDDYVPESNPLDIDRHGKARPHGLRCSSRIIRICDFEAQHCIFVDQRDEG